MWSQRKCDSFFRSSWQQHPSNKSLEIRPGNFFTFYQKSYDTIHPTNITITDSDHQQWYHRWRNSALIRRNHSTTAPNKWWNDTSLEFARAATCSRHNNLCQSRNAGRSISFPYVTKPYHTREHNDQPSKLLSRNNRARHRCERICTFEKRTANNFMRPRNVSTPDRESYGIFGKNYYNIF